ncbi:olfactory receptor 1-like [Spea bombifrons]|uniref:olfactory receptor 1-like n=1 Tax=Spea bombifrons TaxID=233779 RepID=UPI00234A3C7D|nr:olfactory receptor 1-like [Spea bombifrons]
MANNSDVVVFELIGFPGLPPNYHILVSIILFLVYMVSLVANSAVIGIVTWKKTLQHPMYIIIANLALSDLLFDTITLPKIIAKYWFGDGSISFAGCMFQLFCVHYLGALDSFIIMLMAFDRYVAICKPLRYSSIITNRLTMCTCFVLWILASIYSSINATWHSQFPHCHSRKINNCFCVNVAVIILTCEDTRLLRVTSFNVAMVILLLPMSLIILSYIVIIATIASSSQENNWQKAFYTCTTHLFIIAMYYGPRVFIYTSYQFNLVFSLDMSVLILCLYTYIPHMANPIIYCLRNREIRQIIGKTLTMSLHSQK